MKIKQVALIALGLLILITGCEKKAPQTDSRVIIALPSDVETLNPLYTFGVNEGNIVELLYLGLVQHDWDSVNGSITTSPMLAESWDWNNDSSSITFHLRKNVYWTDGKKFSAADVVYSLDLYSDPVVQSRLYGTFKNYFVDKDLHVDLKKTVEVVDSFTLKINFKQNISPQLYDIDFPVLPKHVLDTVARKNLASVEEKLNAVTDGPYSVNKWEKNQSIILLADDKSYLHDKNGINEIVFKIVPEYSSRLIQLNKGEIDLMDHVKTEDIPDIKKNGSLKIEPVKGREYDYVAWNNIDPAIYAESKKNEPNKLFGSKKVREALTYAINRKEILTEYLGEYGQVAVGPVSPIFKRATDTDLKPRQYDPGKAKALLAEDGWADPDKDGILQKGNTKFAFTLDIPGGNPRRAFAATIIKNNLKSVGIHVNVETLEPGVFFDKMFNKMYNAWMGGWSVPIPLDLKPYWYPDLDDAPLNLVSYKNALVGKLLDEVDSGISDEKKDELYKQIQQIIYNDQPVTFMYWIDNIVVYNNKIGNIKITPLGFIHHCWNWTIKE